MKITVHNSGSIDLPVASPDGAYLSVIAAGGTASIEVPAPGVIVIGDKPDLWESIKMGLETLVGVLLAFRKRQRTLGDDRLPSLTISNAGPTGLRVLPGNVEQEVQIDPGSTQTIVGAGYVEVRELSNWNPVEGQPPSP